MMPGMNPKQMGKMMAQMGITQKEIEATQVRITLADKELVIDNPQVVEITMQGVKTYQVVGDAREEGKEAFTEEDVAMVAENTGKTPEEAKAALEKTNGDIAEAIVSLQ